MTQTFECPNCHAALNYDPSSRAVTVRCDFCNSTVIVPETLRTGGSSSFSTDMPNSPILDPMMQTTRLGEVVQLVRSGRKIEAIKLFRETFHVGLKEAKDIVEQMERNETVQLGMTAMQGYGSSSSFSAGSTFNPVLTDSLGQPVVQGGGSSYGRTIGCIILFIFIITALAVVVPIVIGGGAAWFGISQIDEIFSTVESGIETGVEVGISTSIPGPTAPPVPSATPTPGFVTIVGNIGGQEGTGPGFFNDTRQVGVDANGFIYAADYQDGRVQVFDAENNFVTTWNAGEDIYMIAMAVDRLGVVYVPSSTELLRFNGQTGEVLAPFSYNARTSFRGVAAAPDGSVTAAAPDRLVRFDSEGQVILDVADPFNNPALEEAFISLESLAVDGSNNIYFAGQESIYLFDNQGNYKNSFGSRGEDPGQFQGSINAIAIDGRGRIFVEHFAGISVFESNGHFIDLIPADGVAFDMVFNDQNRLIRMDRNGNQITLYALNQ